MTPPGFAPLPTISTDTLLSIEPDGVAEVFDIEVGLTENFIANGLVSHNTRWHPEDLAGKIIAGERLLDGDERTWRHINIPAIAVDTHVERVSNRLGLAAATTVLDTEKQLQRAIPREDWSAAHHWLIWHGRRVCTARNPHCDACPLSALCRDYQTRQAESAARSAHESDTLAL